MGGWVRGDCLRVPFLRHEITRTVGMPSLLENFVREVERVTGTGDLGSGQEIVFVVVTPVEIGVGRLIDLTD